MVETITPMVHGGSRVRWGASVTLHVVAATVVAGAFGALLAVAGHAVGAPWGSGWGAIVGALAIAAMLREAGILRFDVPQLRRQVPDWWRTFFGPHTAAALYGGALGVGFVTFVRHATLGVVAVAAASSGEPLLGAALMAPFGLARGAAAVLAVVGEQAATVDRLSAFAARSRALAVVNALASGLVVVASWPALRDVTFEDLGAVAAAVVAVTFAWGAAWKALRPSAWRSIAGSYPLGPLRGAATVGVPALEAAVALAIPAGYPRAAAVAAVAFLAASSLVIGVAHLRGARRLRCGCFGADEIDTGRALLRNALLALVALLAALGVASGARPTAPVEAVPLTLALAGIVGTAVVVVLVLRGIGAPRAIRDRVRGGAT